LLTRVDRKYVVPRATLAALIASVPTSTRVLEIAGARAFGYRSTYLDTGDLDSYFRAGRRRRRRFKVRTRAYLDTGTCWLEVKTRAGRGVTLKQRVAHPDAELAGLTADGREFVDQELAARRIRGVSAAAMRPVLVTAYQRTTLFLPESASRATVDVDLGWTALPARPPRPGPAGARRGRDQDRLHAVRARPAALGARRPARPDLQARRRHGRAAHRPPRPQVAPRPPP
jgi:hypothetical protein